jgi:hypothetical protein
VPNEEQPHASDLEARFGHPVRLFDALKERVQAEAVTLFSDIQTEWLALMWSLDTFRAASVAPPGLPLKALETLNRGKGNWFAELVALLLQNRTSQHVGARTNVQGFSQPHQIDVAWPARREDPLICAETKVTGGPAYGSTPPRGAMADWTNRRKELKFAATDLKLFRRQQETAIDHWDVWRAAAPPKTYFLWAARLRTPGESKKPADSVHRMVAEAQALINTYLDGAGIFAWQRSQAGGYAVVPLAASARVTDLDDVLHRIAAEIRNLAAAGKPPDPVVPPRRAVGADDVGPDSDETADDGADNPPQEPLPE